MKRLIRFRFGFSGFLKFFWCGMFTAASLVAGTATVQVWVKDAATGKAVKDASLVVHQNASTVSSATSKTTGPTVFNLTVPTSAVEAGQFGNRQPVSFESIEAFPNPCNETVTLNVPPPKTSGPSHLKIYNVLGRRIYSGPIPAASNAGFALDLRLQNLGSGLYLVQSTDSRGNTTFGKFLKIGSSFPSASPTVWMAGIRPFARKENRVPNAAAKTAEGTPYTFTAYTNKNSKDADGTHVGGYASVTVPISKDTTLDLLLEKVPFSEAGQNMAPRSASPITVDGKGDEPAWAQAEWGPMDQSWQGNPPEPDDYTGRYKIVWTPERLYVLVEIRDDVLSDQFPDPLVNYYKDDCVELFIDENASGGIHQYNYNAFAYHIAINSKIVDLGPNGVVKDFTSHADVKWTQGGDDYTWEIGLNVFDDKYNDQSASNQPVTLTGGKLLGFMIAYGDNDGTYVRESFMGSIFIAGQDKNMGWIDAGVFGTLELLP